MRPPLAVSTPLRCILSSAVSATASRGRVRPYMRRWPVSAVRWGRCIQATAGAVWDLAGLSPSPVWRLWLQPLSLPSLCRGVGHDCQRLRLCCRIIDQTPGHLTPGPETATMSILSVYHQSTPEQPFKVLTHHEDIAVTLAEAGVHLERWQASSVIAPNASDEALIAAYQSQIDRLMNERGYA